MKYNVLLHGVAPVSTTIQVEAGSAEEAASIGNAHRSVVAKDPILWEMNFAATDRAGGVKEVGEVPLTDIYLLCD